MITSFLQGGLGNQLFQISAAVSLALENNDEAIFDMANHDLPLQGRKCENYIKTIFRNLKFSSGVPLRLIYREPYFHYRKIEYRPDLCLIGYFQSEKYFEKHADVIKSLFSIDEKTKNLINEKYGEVLKKKPVAVHVRRGDYLKFSDTHPPCSTEYYKKAMESYSDSSFLFFSDDIAWCKDTFVQDNCIFAEDNEDLLDFYLISLCSGVILSNSSFSWWAAWLNEGAKKQIVVPKKWFGKSVEHDTRDLIPSRWKII
tara:strand:+ start:1438 stop:2208 length:771 start_codon:yes stop_codon:yes gene_type:complete